jgi:hypothetical protein
MSSTSNQRNENIKDNLYLVMKAAQATIKNSNKTTSLEEERKTNDSICESVVITIQDNKNNKNIKYKSKDDNNNVSCLDKIYNMLLTDDIGSKSHVSEFATLGHTIVTLFLLSTSFCLFFIYPYYNPIRDWTDLQYSIYFFTWSTWIVLTNVMMKLDWTRFGTFFELLHPITELILILFIYGVEPIIVYPIAFILFVLILVPVMRLSAEKQYAWAVIIGSSMHAIIIIPLFIRTTSTYWSENIEDRKRILIPFAILSHFTYDLTLTLFSVFKPGSCWGQQPFKYQFWLVFCNILAIYLMYTYLFLEKYT